MSDGGERDPGAEEEEHGDGNDAGGRDRFEPDPERVRLLREVAEDVRGDGSERQQLAAVLYRVSDLYDDAESTTPEEIYRSVRFMFEVKERGGLGR
jgi:hypothetical protein